MPSINLRMTQEQHEQLARWAEDGHRSLQKEIIRRLFAEAELFPEATIVLRSVDDPMGPGTVLPELEPAVKGTFRTHPPHNADPKDKASQEHAKGQKKTAGGMCEHRVPIGSYCKRCEEAA